MRKKQTCVVYCGWLSIVLTDELDVGEKGKWRKLSS